MISREELRTLSLVHSPERQAISFYYSPAEPKSRAHNEDAIRIKDLLKPALQDVNGGQETRELLSRIAERAAKIATEGSAVAIFACRDLFRDFTLPRFTKPGAGQVIINSRFHLRPLLTATAARRTCCIALMDREILRIFELTDRDIREVDSHRDEAMRRVKSDGFEGYSAGHRERHVANDAMLHFKDAAEKLLGLYNQGRMDSLLIGCHEQNWQEIEPHLHTYVRQRLLGRFVIDPALATPEEVKAKANAILLEMKAGEQDGIIRDILGESERNGLGVVGLRNVLGAIERGEVRALAFAARFDAPIAECTHCGHLDTRTPEQCAVCSHPNQQVEDALDLIISRALAMDADVRMVSDELFASHGNIGALLRFRADQNTPSKAAS